MLAPTGIKELPPGFAQQAGAVVLGEVVFAQSAAAQQLPQPQVYGGAERLNQVAGQAFASDRRPVVKAQQRVQPGHTTGVHGQAVQQGVAQRQAGIDRVTRRAAVAPGKLQRGGHHARQPGKVGARGGALVAAQALQAGAGLISCDARSSVIQCDANGCQGLQCIKQGLAGIGPLVLQGLQRAVLACQFGLHHGHRPGAAPGVVHHAHGLRQANGSIIVLGAQHDGGAPGAARAHQHGGDACIGQFDQHPTVQPGLAAVDDAAVNQLDGHGAPALAGFI